MKIINPNDKGGYTVEQLQTQYPKLTTVEQIRTKLTEQLKTFVDGADCQFGYVFPDHGLKGKQRVIENDSDILAMYADYKGKRISTLWMKCSWTRPSAQRKRPRSPSASGLPSTSKRSNYESHLTKMTEVEVIMDKLKEEHEERFSAEQLRAWAHMIQMKKYESYENPPDKPFFGKSRKKALSTATEAVISPGKYKYHPVHVCIVIVCLLCMLVHSY